MNRKLKARIIERFGSQWEFARVIGAHETLVSKVVRGRRTLNDEDRFAWAELLGMDINEISGAEDSEPQASKGTKRAIGLLQKAGYVVIYPGGSKQ